MRRLGRATLLGLGLLALDGQAGEAARNLVASGVAAYAQALEVDERTARVEQFRRAERAFEEAAVLGVASADLYVNLGNAALQGERLGAAILAYRRALRLDPDHPRALQNLSHARALLPDWVPRIEEGGFFDSFFFWHRALSRSERARLSALCFAAAALLLALSLRTGQAGWRAAAALPALAWLGLLGSMALDPIARERDAAVLTGSESVARAADSSLAPSLFPEPLPAGVEVEIVERRAPWLRVRLANGNEAWVADSSVTPVLDAG